MNAFSPAFQAALNDMDRRAVRIAECAAIEREARYQEIIRQFSANPSGLLSYLSAPLHWNDPYFSFASTGEAVKFFSRQVERQKACAKKGHRAFDASYLDICSERLRVAEYFNEHGKRLWARSAEAA